MCGELAFFLVCRLMPRGMVQRHSVQVNMQTPFKHISGEGKGCPEGKCPPYPPTNSSIPKDGKLRVGDLGDDVEGTHPNRTDSLEGLLLKLKLQHFDHLMQRANSLEKTLMLGKTESRKRSG